MSMKKQTKEIKGFKGFDKGLKCQGFQYEIGKEYSTQDGDFKLCEKGFHFCENPLDVLGYYPLKDGNKYAEVEALGGIVSDGSKSVTNKIRIKSQIDLSALIKASVAFIWEKASKNKIFGKNSATSGYGAHSATSGYDAYSATSGDDAHSATSGYRAHSATSGDDAHSATNTKSGDAIACAIGRQSSAKASLGCWIVLAEWKEGKEFTDAKPVDVKAVKVDGKKIKANTFYILKGGKFVIADNQND